MKNIKQLWINNANISFQITDIEVIKVAYLHGCETSCDLSDRKKKTRTHRADSELVCVQVNSQRKSHTAYIHVQIISFSLVTGK